MSDVTMDEPAVPARRSAPVQPMYWSVRKELWEHRSLYIVPIVTAVLLIVGMAAGSIVMSSMVRNHPEMHTKMRMEMDAPYAFAAMLVLLSGFITSITYCLDALYGERRNRSILFWKSLPVSDTKSVLAKFLIPLIVQPVIELAVIVVLQITMLLASTIIATIFDSSVLATWRDYPLGQTTLALVYQLFIASLWYAPLYAWLLLISVWAKRVPFLWAVLPPIAISLLELLVFDTSWFASMLKHRLVGGDSLGVTIKSSNVQAHFFDSVDPAAFFASTGLWIGLVFAAASLALAIWLRRRRDSI
ncbi:ABC transporter permease [soil metagenome]